MTSPVVSLWDALPVDRVLCTFHDDVCEVRGDEMVYGGVLNGQPP